MYQPVSSLNLPDFVVQDLETSGYYTTDVDVSKSKMSPKEWTDMTKVPITKSALDIYQEESISGNISTFNKALDEALGGGVPVGLVTEFCGEPGSGKSQICFQLCVNVQLPKWCGGTEGEAVYVTTNRGFASHRIKEIATSYVNNYESFKRNCNAEHVMENTFSVESVLQRIYCINVDDHIELIGTIKHLETWLEDHTNVRLLVIDTISAPLKLLDGQERTHIIYSLLSDLQVLAHKYKFAIVLTNDMTTRVLAANAAYQTPSLGGSYYHRINNRIQLSKESDHLFKACILKHVHKPYQEVVFSFPC